MAVVSGPTHIRFRGRTISRGQGFVDLPDLVCPDEHKVKLGPLQIRGDTGLTCTHKAVQGGGECGALLWLLYVPAFGHQKRFYAADVEYTELQHWEQQSYDAEDVLRYLGVWFPRGDTRALRRRSA